MLIFDSHFILREVNEMGRIKVILNHCLCILYLWMCSLCSSVCPSRCQSCDFDTLRCDPGKCDDYRGVNIQTGQCYGKITRGILC